MLWKLVLVCVCDILYIKVSQYSKKLNRFVCELLSPSSAQLFGCEEERRSNYEQSSCVMMIVNLSCK